MTEPPCPVEAAFREAALMVAQPKPETNPFESEEYQRFVESMVPLCHCRESNRPCDGVLAGGICDGMGDDPEPDEDADYEYDEP